MNKPRAHNLDNMAADIGHLTPTEIRFGSKGDKKKLRKENNSIESGKEGRKQGRRMDDAIARIGAD